MRILVMGASGMAGHVIAEILSREHEVLGLVRSKTHPSVNCIKMDVLETDQLIDFMFTEKFDVVINCVGILNKDASDHIEKAILVNSRLPHLLSRVCSSYGGRVIHLSTDCVFSGNKGSYTENAVRDGDSVYDRTKALGELINNRDLTFRMSIVGPDLDMNGIGLFNWYMKQNEQINGYASFYWTGITTICLARGIQEAIKQNITGLYQLAPSNSISKYELLLLFQKSFNRQGSILPVNEPSSDKSLINTRTDFNFEIPDYAEMINEMKNWISSHASWYNHY